jgi:predicted Rossmann fold flavoprotein
VERYSTVVIGGGAAGIFAAIGCGLKGRTVIICEKMPQLGKKILASGNGRCNLLNEDMSEEHYNPSARELVKSIFNQFGKFEILSFFKHVGLRVYTVDGRIFPATNQAASVLKVLEIELKRLSIPVEYNFNCSNISFTGNGILLSTGEGRRIEARKVIITGGGMSYPAFGSDGSTYEIARKIGHSIIEPVPAVVPLVVKDSLCQVLQGQRINVGVKSIIQGRENQEVRGEMLFTKYGLSGTGILDISEEISIAVNRKHEKEVFLAVDMVPFMDENQLKVEIKKRQKEQWPVSEMLVGILPNKISAALKPVFEAKDIDAMIRSLKRKRFRVSGTRGWNEAEFTAGGVNVSEVETATLESKFKKGVYFAGEILDVNGKRGGYNLGWAWASGWVAGQAGLTED